MRKPALLAVVVVWLVASGCIELERKKIAIRTSIENPVEIGIKGLGPSTWPGGLGGFAEGGERSYYRVGKTDTLVSLAERFYGSRIYAREIMRVNEEALKGEKGLVRGMILALPELDLGEVYGNEPPAGEDARP